MQASDTKTGAFADVVRKKHAKAGAFAYFLRSQNYPRTMHKLGTGIITSNQDVDRLEFDWGKIHFLSEPAVTGAVHFSFGIVELAAGKGHAPVIIQARLSGDAFPQLKQPQPTFNYRN